MKIRQEFCTKCNAKLNPIRMVLLEYNEPRDRYSEITGNAYSNAFPFGKDCAKAVIANKGRLIWNHRANLERDDNERQ